MTTENVNETLIRPTINNCVDVLNANHQRERSKGINANGKRMLAQRYDADANNQLSRVMQHEAGEEELDLERLHLPKLYLHR